MGFIYCLLAFYLASSVLGAAGAWIIAAYGPQTGLLDCPNKRSSHCVPTPKGGGIGIFAAFVLVCTCFRIPFAFWLPVSIVAIIGLHGDRIELSPKLRLCVQFGAAIVLILGVGVFQPYDFWWLLLAPLWAIFIVGTANFYNFMDGINGIAGITGIVGFGLLASFGYFYGMQTPFVILAICISSSCIGFLPFNMPKAKVFMGDVGSIFLGFAFAGMVIWLSKSLLDFICMAAFLFPFYADELTTMVVRLRDGENLTSPHRRHLYQLLANEGNVSHWKVAVGYGLGQLAVGASILLVEPFGSLVVVPILMIYFGGFVVLSFNFRRKLEN